jgi:hypothetical protein
VSVLEPDSPSCISLATTATAATSAGLGGAGEEVRQPPAQQRKAAAAAVRIQGGLSLAPAARERVVAKLSAQKINNIFTHLRKVGWV